MPNFAKKKKKKPTILSPFFLLLSLFFMTDMKHMFTESYELMLIESCRDEEGIKWVENYIKDNPDFNFNFKTKNGEYTLLDCAVRYGRTEVVKLLLDRDDVDPNVCARGESTTPFLVACERSCGEKMIKLFIANKKVDMVKHDLDNKLSPISWLVCSAYMTNVEQIIASGRYFGHDLMTRDYEKHRPWLQGDERVYTECNLITLAKNRRRSATVKLLEKFDENQDKTRHRIRIKLGYKEEIAAETFALVIFLCSDLLKLKKLIIPSPLAPAQRFFKITRRLPMELQMILCHRVLDSTKEYILRKYSEVAFKSLAKIVL